MFSFFVGVVVGFSLAEMACQFIANISLTRRILKDLFNMA